MAHQITCTVEAWELLSNFVPHFTMDVIIHTWIIVKPC